MNKKAQYIMLRVLALVAWGTALFCGALYLHFEAEANKISSLKSYTLLNSNTALQLSLLEEETDLSRNTALTFAVVGLTLSIFWGYRRSQLSFRGHHSDSEFPKH